MKKITEDIKESPVHYLSLFIILFFGGFSFFYLKRNQQAQLVSVFLTSSFYFIWGVVHHLLEGDLHIRIVMEYLAMSILGFVLLWALIYRV